MQSLPEAATLCPNFFVGEFAIALSYNISGNHILNSEWSIVNLQNQISNAPLLSKHFQYPAPSSKASKRRK